MQIINSKTDLDAIKGTPEYDEVMARLAGSIYRVERNDAEQKYDVVQDTSTIERFGLTLADFPDAKPPTILPEWKDPIEAWRKTATVSKFQAKAALAQAGLLGQVKQAVANADTITQLAWEDATAFNRNSPTIATLAQALGLTDEQVDELFRQAEEISA